MWALKNSVLVSMSTVYLNFDRRETRLETVVLVSRVCKNLSNTLLHTFLKRVKLHYKSLYIPPMNTVPQGGQTESLCEGNGGMWSLEISAGRLVLFSLVPWSSQSGVQRLKNVLCHLLQLWARAFRDVACENPQQRNQSIIVLSSNNSNNHY